MLVAQGAARETAWIVSGTKANAAAVKPFLGASRRASWCKTAPWARFCTPAAFIQDPLDYGSRTHHSNLMQASAVLAAFVYDAATRAEMLPRKPLPRPLPKPK